MTTSPFAKFASSSPTERARIVLQISREANLPVKVVCEQVWKIARVAISPEECKNVAGFIPQNAVGGKSSQFSGQIPEYPSYVSIPAAERMRRWNR